MCGGSLAAGVVLKVCQSYTDWRQALKDTLTQKEQDPWGSSKSSLQCCTCVRAPEPIGSHHTCVCKAKQIKPRHPLHNCTPTRGYPHCVESASSTECAKRLELLLLPV